MMIGAKIDFCYVHSIIITRGNRLLADQLSLSNCVNGPSCSFTTQVNYFTFWLELQQIKPNANNLFG